LPLLLDVKGIDVNAHNGGHNTPFHYLCRYWNDKDTIVELMTRFVQLGADVNAETASTGETPLFKVFSCE
jgi:ankyrin repeat protein